jgi:hypothetical protein
LGVRSISKTNMLAKWFQLDGLELHLGGSG